VKPVNINDMVIPIAISTGVSGSGRTERGGVGGGGSDGSGRGDTEVWAVAEVRAGVEGLHPSFSYFALSGLYRSGSPE
jgi:hypothetical protein